MFEIFKSCVETCEKTVFIQKKGHKINKKTVLWIQIYNIQEKLGV